jgi:hypothetical protein
MLPGGHVASEGEAVGERLGLEVGLEVGLIVSHFWHLMGHR